MKKVEPSSPSSSEELALGLELESDVKPVIFGPAFAFTFTRLDARCFYVCRVIRSSIEDTGEGDDNTVEPASVVSQIVSLQVGVWCCFFFVAWCDWLVIVSRSVPM